MAVKRQLLIRVGAIAASAFMATCAGSGGPSPDGNTAQSGAALGGVNGTLLRLTQETLSCSSTGVENVLSIANYDTSPVPLSAITVKLWVDETTASSIVASVSNAGCISAHGTTSNDCAYQGKVRGVTATAVKMASPCGPAGSGVANWEVTITNTDTGVIPPGQSWHKLHSNLALPSNAAFTPGTSAWYSACQPIDGVSHDTQRMAVYINGDLVTASPGVPPSCVAPHGSQPVPGAVAPAVAAGNFPLVGPEPPGDPIDLAIALPLPNPAAVDAFIARTQDPSDALFHQYVDAAGFAALYGPSQSDYDAVVAWAGANGLTVTKTYPSRTIVNVRGTAAAVEKALFVTLNQYQRADGSIFYAPVSDPSPNIGVPILSITGLDTLAIPQPLDGNGTAFSGGCPAGNGATGHGYVGLDVRNYYFPTLSATNNDGVGQTVALIEFDSFYDCAVLGTGCTGYVSDPQKYANDHPIGTLHVSQTVVNQPPDVHVAPASNNLNLGSCTSLSPCSITVDIPDVIAAGFPSTGVLTIHTTAAGGGITQVKYTAAGGNQFQGIITNPGVLTTGDLISSPIVQRTGEPALDTEMVFAMAPGATIKLFEWEHNAGAAVSSSAFQTLLTAVANDSSVNVVNNSWVWQNTGTASEQSIKNTFRLLAAQGKTFVQAAGDTGAYVSAPACGSAGHCRFTPGASCNANADCGGTCDTVTTHKCSISQKPCNTTADCADLCFSGVPSPIIDSPYMLVVGGTQLPTTGVNVTEQVWNNSAAGTVFPDDGASSGGKALCYTNGLGTSIAQLDRPSWQDLVNTQSGINSPARMIPDVTLVATQLEGYVLAEPTTLSTGNPHVANPCLSGTSASAALWAGAVALINQKAPPTSGNIGFANPRLYSVAQTPGNFNDITAGNTTFNGSTGSPANNAVAGFDLASGLGTPTVQLINTSLPPQACQSGSNLTIVVRPDNSVWAYAPNGSWQESAQGVMAVELEKAGGSKGTLKALIPTPGDAINTCAGDSAYGLVVCTGNNNNIYFIQGTSVVNQVSTNAATGSVGFSGGSCKTCNVAVDPVSHSAWISIGIGTGVGVQRMDLGVARTAIQNAQALTPTTPGLFDAAIVTNNSNDEETLSEAIGVDPGTVGRTLVLSPNELNNYQLIDGNTHQVFDHTNAGGLSWPTDWMDGAAEDCSTGIIVASVEFSEKIYLADLHQVTFDTVNSTWSTPAESVKQISELDDPAFNGGVVGGVAVTSNASLHLGVMANEFGGGGFVVFQLPSTSGSGVPQLVDWATAGLPSSPAPYNNPWWMGKDPHTLGVYTSPNTGRQYAIFQNDPFQNGVRDVLARVDLEKLLFVASRTPVANSHMVDPAYDLVTNNVVDFFDDN